MYDMLWGSGTYDAGKTCNATTAPGQKSHFLLVQIKIDLVGNFIFPNKPTIQHRKKCTCYIQVFLNLDFKFHVKYILNDII